MIGRHSLECCSWEPLGSGILFQKIWFLAPSNLLFTCWFCFFDLMGPIFFVILLRCQKVWVSDDIPLPQNTHTHNTVLSPPNIYVSSNLMNTCMTSMWTYSSPYIGFRSPRSSSRGKKSACGTHDTDHSYSLFLMKTWFFISVCVYIFN